MPDNKIIYIKYAKKLEKFKKIALAAGNRDLENIYKQLLFSSNIKKYASYVTGQTITKTKPKPFVEVLDDDLPSEEVKGPIQPPIEEEFPELGDRDYEKSKEPFSNRIKPSIFPSIEKLDSSEELEQELRGAVKVNSDGSVSISNPAAVQRVFAIMFIRHAEELARVAVAHFMGLPSSIRNWATNPVVPQELRNRYNNKLMQETTIQNIIKLRGKLSFDPKRQESPGKYTPSEVEESVIGQEIIDRTMQVLLNNNGIFLGNIEKLVGYIVTDRHQKVEYSEKSDRLPKDANESLKQLDINVDPNSFDGKFVQGLGKLVFTVVAQQFMERWGATDYDKDTGSLKYRHIGREPHPSGQVSFEDPTFGNPTLRNVFQFVPVQGKRRDINLEDDHEHMLKSIFDINESGQQAFNELYDVRVNKSDQQYLGQHLAVDAKMLAQKIVRNFENLFGKTDPLTGDEIIKPSSTSFKMLFAFYLQIMSWMKEGKGGFQSTNTSQVKVPPQMFDYLNVKYDPSRIDNTEKVLSQDKTKTMYENPFIPIKPFGLDQSAARAIWKKNEADILGPPINNNQVNGNAETPREIYREIFNQINSVNKDQLSAMNRILANELQKGIQNLFANKLGKLIDIRKSGKKQPRWNKPGNDPSQHEWAEYSAVLYALINNIEIISEIAPAEILTTLKQDTERVFNKQLGPKNVGN